MFTLAAGLIGTASAQDFDGDQIAFSLHYPIDSKASFKADNPSEDILRPTAWDKTARGIFLFDRVDQHRDFKWSPDPARIPIQQVR
jgi:hypothetical protein